MKAKDESEIAGEGLACKHLNDALRNEQEICSFRLTDELAQITKEGKIIF